MNLPYDTPENNGPGDNSLSVAPNDPSGPAPQPDPQQACDESRARARELLHALRVVPIRLQADTLAEFAAEVEALRVGELLYRIPTTAPDWYARSAADLWRRARILALDARAALPPDPPTTATEGAYAGYLDCLLAWATGPSAARTERDDDQRAALTDRVLHLEAGQHFILDRLGIDPHALPDATGPHLHVPQLAERAGSAPEEADRV